MPKSQSVVCTFLQLPPEEQTFARIRVIPTLFPPQLDYLNLVVAAVEEANPSLLFRGKENLDEVRKTAGRLCGSLSSVISHTRDFATSSLTLVDSLRAASPTEQILQHVSSVVILAGSNVTELQKTEKEVAKFAQSIESIVSSIRSRSTYRHGATAVEEIVPTAEISGVVDEIVRGLHECAALLQEVIAYYRRIRQHYSKAEALKSDPPSKEEIEVVRERWIGFLRAMENLAKGFSKIHRRLERPPVARRYDDVSGSWTADESSSLFSDSDSESETETLPQEVMRHQGVFSGHWGSVFRKGLGSFWSSVKGGLQRGKVRS